MYKYVCIILLALLIWMGVSYKIKSDEADSLKKKLTIAQLPENEKIRIVYKEKEKKIYIIKRVGTTEVTTTDIIDINNSDSTIGVGNNDELIIQPKPWLTFPMNLTLGINSCHETKIVGGVRLVQFGKYAAGINVGQNDLSVSLDREFYDLLPMLQNSFFGAFYNFADENNRGGLQIGVKL